MAIVMNMSSYEIKHSPVESGYDKETLRSDWNPVLARLSLQPVVSTANKQRTMPAELATVNVELFLQRM